MRENSVRLLNLLGFHSEPGPWKIERIGRNSRERQKILRKEK